MIQGSLSCLDGSSLHMKQDMEEETYQAVDPANVILQGLTNNAAFIRWMSDSGTLAALCSKTQNPSSIWCTKFGRTEI